ncbi:uncharacterized protein L201_003742 [Kwoniella dendrophila CBS 6074]|uniref:Uncharacterized protein n=1 Tax=Kwoniella dendrophila CBS 6074 TaxID=1295534 RepID=A0AAX4JTZ6_9TREE
MFFLYTIGLLLLSLFVSAAPTPITPESLKITQSQTAILEPVKFLNHFGSNIPADSNVKLEWQGGSGKGFDVYYIPQWPEQTDYYPVAIVSDTTETHITWHTPKKSDYPKGTTFIIGVNDAVTSLSSNWYDITGLMTFAH